MTPQQHHKPLKKDQPLISSPQVHKQALVFHHVQELQSAYPMTGLTKSMCWELFTIKKDKLNSVGAAMYRKPITNDCYENRNEQKPPMCTEDDDPNAAWYVPLQSCMHQVPVDPSVCGSHWRLEWPRRAQVPPYWLNSSHMGVYGRSAPDDFIKDYEHWRRVVNMSYLNGFVIDWPKVRNVMDMRVVYGRFACDEGIIVYGG